MTLCKDCQKEQLTTIISEKIAEWWDKLVKLAKTIAEIFDWLMEKLLRFVQQFGLWGVSGEIDTLLDYLLNSNQKSGSSNYGSDFVSTNSPSCNDTNFVLANWVDDSAALVYPSRLNNLKRIHSELLVPIVKYYKEKATDQFIKDACILQILTGLTTDQKLIDLPVGIFNLHFTGQACNFKILGVNDEQIIDDFLNRRLPVTPGVISKPNGIYITLPYSVNNTLVENVYVYNGSSGALEYKFF